MNPTDHKTFGFKQHFWWTQFLHHCYAHTVRYPRATHSCCSFSVINAAGKTGNFGSKIAHYRQLRFFCLKLDIALLLPNGIQVTFHYQRELQGKTWNSFRAINRSILKVSWAAACSALLSLGLSHQQSTEQGVQRCPSVGATQAGHGTWQWSTAPPKDKGRHPAIQKQTSAEDGDLSHAQERKLWSITGLVRKCRLAPTEPHHFSSPECLLLPKLVGKWSLQAYLRTSCLRTCCR